MTTTIDIPDGWAILRDPKDITERGRRLIITALAPLQGLVTRTFDTVPEDLRKAAQGKGPDAEAAQARIDRLANSSTSTRQEAAASLEVRDAAIIALLAEWSLDRPLPTIDNLLDLPGDLFRALEEAASPFVKDVLAAAMGTSFEPNPGRDTPFGKSSTSSTGSKGAARRSTKRPRNSGASTSSAGTSVPA